MVTVSPPSIQPNVSETSSLGGAANPGRAPDTFGLTPFYVVAALWALTILPIVYEPGNLFFPVTLLPGVLILPVALLAWLIVLLVSLVKRQWRRCLSLVVAMLVFPAIALLTMRFDDEICFWTLSPYYFNKVAQLQPDRDGFKKAKFNWRGGLGWDEQLIYDDADTIVTGTSDVPGTSTERGIGLYHYEISTPGSHNSAERLYGHFYLETYVNN
jgi:hypothetical protein